MALNENIKKAIQSAYTQWLDVKRFKPRRSQRQMIATVANVIGNVESDIEGRRIPDGDSHIALIEAGTGTGKTVAYLLPAILLARELNKKLVVATATINLQEQLIEKDIPDLAESAGLEFEYALAKGRARYLCLNKLKLRLDDGSKTENSPALFPDEQTSLTAEAIASLDAFNEQFYRSNWDGDRDNFSGSYDEMAFGLVAADGVTCTGRKCQFFSQCPLFQARDKLLTADVVVANHDLVLANQLAGGSILPPVEETIFIFDEAHHLPEKSRNRQARSLSMRAEISALTRTKQLFQRVASVAGVPKEAIKNIEKQALDVDAGILSTLNAMNQLVATLGESIDREGQQVYRFPFGVVDSSLADLMDDLGACYSLKVARLNKLNQVLDEYKGAVPKQGESQLEALLVSLNQLIASTENAEIICNDYAANATAEQVPQVNAAAEPPKARWFDMDEQGVVFHTEPLSAAKSLREGLWDTCFAAVLTSATLAALGSFSSFVQKTGCESRAAQSRLLGELSYQNALFHVPDMQFDPGRAVEHTEEVIRLIPDLLHPQNGSLVLFSSFRQMEEVRTALSGLLNDGLFVQGSLSKQELIKRHKARIDAGQPSVIFGLASFSEGVDLPGKYCEQVIIAKLPFSVPDTPTDQAFSEWVEQQGGNSFYDLALPETSVRLVQACGRLLRSESDSGRISLLDNRVVTRRYGESLLAALPPFRLDVSSRKLA